MAARLRKVLRRTGTGIQYVEHTEGDGAEMLKRSASSDLREWFQKS